MKKELLELADRTESGTDDEDFELDELVAKLTGWRQLGEEWGASAGHWVSPADWEAKKVFDGWVSLKELPSFSGSVDGAMRVIPEGRHTELAMQDRHSGNWKWILRGGFGIRSEARAKTMPRAILAAALRAHASKLDEHLNDPIVDHRKSSKILSLD